MDFLTFLLAIVAGYLWWQLRELAGRVRDAESERKRLEQSVAFLIGKATAEQASPAPMPAPDRPVSTAAMASAAAAANPPLPASLAPPAPGRTPTLEPAPSLTGVDREGFRCPLGPRDRPPPPPLARKLGAKRRQASPSPVLWAGPAMASDRGGTSPVSARPAVPSGPSVQAKILARLGLSPTEDGKAPTRAAVEAWLEGRMLAVVGGIALTLGAAFFLSLAFSRGWITEPMRVLIGLGGGITAIVLGELAFMRVKGVLGHVLLAVGLAVVSLSLFAATRLFGLIPAEVGVAGALLAAIVAAAIAIRHDSELVAAFGLIAVLAAPPLLGATPTLVTIFFLATALVGTTVIALFRTWIWLPPLAFLLAAPQVASSTVGGESVPVAMATIAGFWLLNTIAAGGEEIRHPTDRLRPSTVTLLLANTAFTLWAGTTVLDGAYAHWRGSFVAAVALANLALGLGLLVRQGDRHPFGLVVAATGVASITMAVPIQFGATWVPVAWAAEAVALTWVATRFRHPHAAGAALVLGALSLGHLLVIEYPVTQIAVGYDRTWPFVGPEGLTFAFLLGAAAVAGLIVRTTWVCVWLGVIGLLTTAYVLPFETSGAWLVGAWSGLAVAGIAAWRFLIRPRLDPNYAERGFSALGLAAWARPIEQLVVALSRTSGVAFVATALLLASLSLGYLLLVEYPLDAIAAGFDRTWPFVGPQGLAYAFVIGAVFVAGLIVRATWFRVLLVIVGIGLTTYVLPFELSGTALVVAWSALTVASMAVWRFAIAPRRPVDFVERNFAAVGSARPAQDGRRSGRRHERHRSSGVRLDRALANLPRDPSPGHR